MRYHSTVNDARKVVGPWVAYAAALWAAVFAVFHIVWATGWYPLLDAEQARANFAVPWKYAYLVTVCVVCVIAVPVALAPVSWWGAHVPRRLVFALACTGTALLLLRFVASLVQTAWLIAVGRFHIGILGVWDWWFILGTVLFTFSTWRSWRLASESGTARER